MKRFIDEHQAAITGTISCFDRILFKGHLSLGWPDAMEGFISRQGLRIKGFGRFVSTQSERIKQHAKAMADKTGRLYVYLSGPVRKEERARAIAQGDKITEGLVCILAAVEGCRSFKIAYGQRRPKIVPARRKCLCLYFYFVDGEFGFLHVGIATWFPFTVQVCLNGHDWVARKMDHHGIRYRKLDNAFLSIDDPQRAQRLAERFAQRNWPRILTAFARRVNPLMKNLLRGMHYYWVTEQAEFATDVMFQSPTALAGLYENLLKHATHCFGAEDVMTFLGRKLNGNFQADIGNHYKKRWPGARVRHRMKNNGMKMYDKHGSVLRIETLINRPYEFKVWRRGIRHGEQVTGWYPMAKRVTNLARYAEVSLAANRRYLDALAVVDDPTPARQKLRRLACRVRKDGRSYRGFNPAAAEDIQLFAAIMRGEHAINGFRNRDIRDQLFKFTRHSEETVRHSARVSRLLKRLHVHGLIAKIPRSRRWRVTHKGHSVMTTILTLHNEHYPQLLTRQTA